MASVSGPLMSFDASGSIGKAVVFSKWRGRNYVRGHAVPSNPNSQAQRFTRAMMSFLSKAWGSLDPEDQATWASFAAGDNLPTFNGFIRGNMDRWKNLMAPSTTYPAPGGGGPTSPTAFTATPLVRTITGEITIDTDAGIWGSAVQIRSGTAPATSIAWTAAVVLTPGDETTPYIIRNVTPGVWSVSVATFSIDGGLNSPEEDIEITVPAS